MHREGVSEMYCELYSYVCCSIRPSGTTVLGPAIIAWRIDYMACGVLHTESHENRARVTFAHLLLDH